MRSMRGIRVGFGVAALVLGGGLLSAPTATAQSSSPGCFPPCTAAEFYLSAIGYVQFSGNPARCRSQCADMRKGCFNTVAAAERCLRGSSTSFLDIALRNCVDLLGSAKKECTDSVNSDNSGLQSFIKDDVLCGKQTCEGAFQDCLQSCVLD